MLLTITTTHRPATDLGYLLAKNPARCQSFDLSFGRAWVFYPEVSEERTSAALLLDLDPVGLVRGRRGPRGERGTLAQYINDRPYVASSFVSSAISRVFGSALGGRSRERPELAETAIPLEACLQVVPARGGEGLLRELFEPLGYTLDCERHALDTSFESWGPGPYFSVRLAATCRLSELLTHLYVLLPVLDNEKHYWVGRDELEKLLAKGESWLAEHPRRESIVQRYLRHQRGLVKEALSRLVAEEDPDFADREASSGREEASLERELGLNEQRLQAVAAVLAEARARRVIDLGCGEGKLLALLLRDDRFSELVGVDVSGRALELAGKRLKLDRLPDRQRERIRLLHGALTYRDERFAGFDAAAAVEVVEHLDPWRLPAFERVLFALARPRLAVVTTPNVEYNARFGLPTGRLRHRDHRFEWTRSQFQDWARRVGESHGYGVRFDTVGSVDPQLGAPTQMGIFSR